MREDIVLLNLPTFSIQELVLVKFNRQGCADQIAKIDGTSNLTTLVDVDSSRDILDIRNHPGVVDRFFGLESEATAV